MRPSPMWLDSRVIVVVPAWNEAPRIGRVVRGMPAWVDDIVVVDDASRDDTVRAALGTGDERVRVVRHEHNRGVGAAIATGYRYALLQPGGPRDAFAVMAGDAQMDPEDLPRLITPIAEGRADYVKGNRFVWPDAARSMPRARRLAGVAFSWATSGAIGVRVSDSQCGYTAITRAACGRVDLDGLWPSYGYPNDLLSALALAEQRIREVAVRPVYADEVSRLRPRHVAVVAGIVARAWLRRQRQALTGGSPQTRW